MTNYLCSVFEKEFLETVKWIGCGHCKKWVYRKCNELSDPCDPFSLKIANKSCNKGLKYCKFLWNRNKAKYVMKKIILKGNTTTKFIEYKHKNTGTSKSICISGLQRFNSYTNCWKAVSLKPYGLSVEIWSRLVSLFYLST